MTYNQASNSVSWPEMPVAGEANYYVGYQFPEVVPQPEEEPCKCLHTRCAHEELEAKMLQKMNEMIAEAFGGMMVYVSPESDLCREEEESHQTQNAAASECLIEIREEKNKTSDDVVIEIVPEKIVIPEGGVLLDEVPAQKTSAVPSKGRPQANTQKKNSRVKAKLE